MQVKKQQLELDMEQETGFTLGKEFVKAVYCHPVYLIYLQRTIANIGRLGKQGMKATNEEIIKIMVGE